MPRKPDLEKACRHTDQDIMKDFTSVTQQLLTDPVDHLVGFWIATKPIEVPHVVDQYYMIFHVVIKQRI
jgi:hypothetical protein